MGNTVTTLEYESRAYFLLWLAHHYWNGVLDRFTAGDPPQFDVRMSGRFDGRFDRSCAGCCCQGDGICLDSGQEEEADGFCFVW